MEENFVWVTTRQIKPGTLADFKRLWRPGLAGTFVPNPRQVAMQA